MLYNYDIQFVRNSFSLPSLPPLLTSCLYAAIVATVQCCIANNNIDCTACMYMYTDVLVEFDPTSYMITEGGILMFRIVRQTSSDREVTVIFNTRTDSASGKQYNIRATFYIVIHSY